MAADQAILDEAATSGRATLRLYRWHPPCLSLGRNQKIEGHGIAVVRRPTGGGAVWHEHELTYAVAAPLAVFGGLRAAYVGIHQAIAAALRSLGADVSLAPHRRLTRPAPSPTACFSTPTGGEILANGRKLVGSAQVRKRDAFLQHGSILLDGTQEIVGRLDGEGRGKTEDGGATTLRIALGRIVTFDEVADALVRESARLSGAVSPPLQS